MLAVKEAALRDWNEFQHGRQCLLIPLMNIKDLVQLSLSYLEGSDPFYWYEEHLFIYIAQDTTRRELLLAMNDDPFLRRFIDYVAECRDQYAGQEQSYVRLCLTKVEKVRNYWAVIDSCNRLHCYFRNQYNGIIKLPCVCDRPLTGSYLRQSVPTGI